MREIYCIGGLGADERVFRSLEISNCQKKVLQWTPPHSDEDITDYATRLSEQIKTVNPFIVGISFGGMIAIEIAKKIKTAKVIIISSAKTADEIPSLYRLMGRLSIQKMIPSGWLIGWSFIINWLFGVHVVADRQLLREILHDTDPVFLKWAISRILNWPNKKVPDNVVHIHGSADRLLPIMAVKPDIVINNGSHFMIVTRASEISGKINEIISKVK